MLIASIFFLTPSLPPISERVNPYPMSLLYKVCKNIESGHPYFCTENCPLSNLRSSAIK